MSWVRPKVFSPLLYVYFFSLRRCWPHDYQSSAIHLFSKYNIFRILLFSKCQIRKTNPSHPSVKTIKTRHSHEPGSILLHQASATVRGWVLQQCQYFKKHKQRISYLRLKFDISQGDYQSHLIPGEWEFPSISKIPQLRLFSNDIYLH